LDAPVAAASRLARGPVALPRTRSRAWNSLPGERSNCARCARPCRSFTRQRCPAYPSVQYSPSLKNSAWSGDQGLGTDLALADPTVSRGRVSCTLMIGSFLSRRPFPRRKGDRESSHRRRPRLRPAALTRTAAVLGKDGTWRRVQAVRPALSSDVDELVTKLTTLAADFSHRCFTVCLLVTFWFQRYMAN